MFANLLYPGTTWVQHFATKVEKMRQNATKSKDKKG